MRRSTCFILASALTLGGGALLGQDAAPAEKPAKKQKKERERARLEDAIRRALIRAKEIDDDKIDRVTCYPATTVGTDSDEYGYLVLVEFGSRSLGIFAGGQEESADRWILVEKSSTFELQEAIERMHRR
jgi:hypothetical protein